MSEVIPLINLDVAETIRELEGEMLKAAEDLHFEKAALLRDQIKELKHMIDGGPPAATPASYRKSSKRRGQGGGGAKSGPRGNNPF